MPATTITDDGARRLITSAYRPKDILVLDSSYSLIDDAMAAEYFKSVSNETVGVIGSWMENVRDCDKFSRVVACIAMLSHMRQSRSMTGLALGVFAYTRDDGVNHAVNLVITKLAKKEQINIRLFEPQTGFEIILSKFEKSRVLWVFI